MSNTLRTYTSDGVQVLYPIDFTLGYLRRGYVYVYTGEDYTSQVSYTWVNDSQIQLATPVTNGEELYIRRVVPRNQLVNVYEDQAIRSGKNINDSYLQALMILEELSDGFMTDVGVEWNLFGDLNMHNNKIVNLAEGVLATDGVNKSQLDAVQNLFVSGAEDFIRDVFVDGVDFTAGASTTLSLSANPGSRDNTWVYFDEVFQSPDKYIVLTGDVIFNSAIPGGTTKVEVRYSKALPTAGVPTDAGRTPKQNPDNTSIFLREYEPGDFIIQDGTTTSIVTPPADSEVNFPLGTEFTVYRLGDINVLVSETLPTVHIPDGATNALAKKRAMMLKKVAPDEWVAVGGFLLP